MKLWLLRPVEGLPDKNNPWEPWYDKAFGFVVRAETEKEARKFAHKEAGDENRGRFLDEAHGKAGKAWLSPEYSTCIELEAEGEPGVIVRDFASA